MLHWDVVLATLYNLIPCNSMELEYRLVMMMMREMGGFVWFVWLAPASEIVTELLKWQEAIRENVLR